MGHEGLHRRVDRRRCRWSPRWRLSRARSASPGPWRRSTSASRWPAPAYNLFLTGPPGSGRMSTIPGALRPIAGERPRPHDLVYIHDVDRPDRPRGIRLPAGAGAAP
ncbi:MAG: AAA family ATPase [Candidatus Dormibacteraeota bacterium]|nr:AAA family ATPase [Candidatus Dormibacteraeota bacterium]